MRTRAEQSIWDAVFQDQLHRCLDRFNARGPEFCAHRARDIADASLNERRDSRKRDTKRVRR